VQTARRALEKLDLVETTERGGYRLADIFLRLWLRRFV